MTKRNKINALQHTPGGNFYMQSFKALVAYKGEIYSHRTKKKKLISQCAWRKQERRGQGMMKQETIHSSTQGGQEGD